MEIDQKRPSLISGRRGARKCGTVCERGSRVGCRRREEERGGTQHCSLGPRHQMSSKVVAPRAIIEVTGGALDVQMYDTEGDPPAGSRA